MFQCRFRLALALLLAAPLTAVAQNADKPKEEPPKLDTSRGDAMIAEYFRRETRKLADACLADIQTADDWNAKKDEYRRQLREMLGLDPLPEKTDLKATITGTLEHEEFTVVKLHFQSRPGLYVTGNLYVPKQREGKLPAILYVCGHGNIKKDGISYGAKSHYQHHGAWFARNGYVCLVIDTLQLGEIEGIHHGTYRYGMWWWLNRGYTPAGVEAWNCVRALDYLQSRPEVDPEKLGVTGRSGGGAYSWWIAAIDERIKCAVPVAGITDLQNHVVDGCVEGHCDCMYMVNTYRWDYPQVAALVAPRPLLISNTDSDGIFPLDGVVRVFDKARRIYTLLGKRDQIGLTITSGGHKDTQELQVTCMRWFNQHLRGYDGPVTNHAEKFFEPEQLKVFDKLPEDEINTKIHETFVAAAPPPKVPESKEEWEKMREGWLKELKEKCFRAWPTEAAPPKVQKRFDVTQGRLRLQAYDFATQAGIALPLYVLDVKSAKRPNDCIFVVTGTAGMRTYLGGLQSRFDKPPEEIASLAPSDAFVWGDPFGDPFGKDSWEWGRIVFFSPRGEFSAAWDQSQKKQIQNRRRFMLLGTSLETMQAWDVRRAIAAIRTIEQPKLNTLLLSGDAETSGTCLLASLFESGIGRMVLRLRGTTPGNSTTILNVDKVLSEPLLVALAADRCTLAITVDDDDDWSYLREVAAKLGWDSQRFQMDEAPAASR